MGKSGVEGSVKCWAVGFAMGGMASVGLILRAWHPRAGRSTIRTALSPRSPKDTKECQTGSDRLLGLAIALRHHVVAFSGAADGAASTRRLGVVLPPNRASFAPADRAPRTVRPPGLERIERLAELGSSPHKAPSGQPVFSWMMLNCPTTI